MPARARPPRSAKLTAPASLRATICINGKFTAQPTTGVQRVAARLVQALDALLLASPATGHRWLLLCPAGAVLPRLAHIEARCIGPARLPLHAWEQAVLPWATRGALLVNLAGSAPAATRRQVCMLHDAAVFDHPEAYTRAFVAWYDWLFRRLARRAARLLTVSAFSRDRLAARLRLDPSRIGIVPNGGDHFDAVVADAAVLARYGLQGTRFLLAVASANPNKNLAALVRAFSSLPRDAAGLRLVIVGGGRERVFAGEPGDASGAADPAGVQRLGVVADAALKALYANATALVFPSLYEGFGLPPLEAMACGCPVAAADAAAIPEVCGDAALYFDPRSVAAIAGAMQRLLDDAALRDRLRAAGRSRAAQHRWADAAAALLAQVLPELRPEPHAKAAGA